MTFDCRFSILDWRYCPNKLFGIDSWILALTIGNLKPVLSHVEVSKIQNGKGLGISGVAVKKSRCPWDRIS
jgi:hypothetical protein